MLSLILKFFPAVQLTSRQANVSPELSVTLLMNKKQKKYLFTSLVTFKIFFLTTQCKNAPLIGS